MKIAAISIADYAEATEGMPHDAERLFFRILLKMYSREGALPDNDSDNARMFGYDTRRYKRLKYILLKFPQGISIVDGEIRNSRVDKELPGIAARKQMLREAGAKGGKSDRSRIEVGSKSDRSRSEVEAKSDRSCPASDMQQPAKSDTYAKHTPTPTPTPTKEAVVSEAQKPTYATLHDRLLAAAGNALDLTRPDLHSVAEPMIWLDAGASLEQDVLPTVESISKLRRPGTIKGWKYFRDAVKDAKDNREQGGKAFAAPAKPKPRGTFEPPSAEAVLAEMVKTPVRKIEPVLDGVFQ